MTYAFQSHNGHFDQSLSISTVPTSKFALKKKYREEEKQIQY